MAKLRIFVGVCCVFFVIGVATAATFVWVGGGSGTNWTTAAKWDQNSGYPGQGAATDNVVIDKSQTSSSGDFPVDVTATLPHCITNLTMQDGISSATVGVRVSDSDSTANESLLEVTGTLLVQERTGQSGAYIEKVGDDQISVSGHIEIHGGSSTTTTLQVTGGTIVSTSPNLSPCAQ